jgi:hypothetical protein
MTSTSTATRHYDGQRFATETLVTDTVAYDVVRHTAKTITVRRRRHTDVNRRDPHVDQGPYPVIWTETESDPTYPQKVLRLRKDGTYRTHSSSNPLRFTNEAPEVRTDYRF